ncbi:uncharacterized protein L969DRAFT_46843 [Mixia osmundae IAM 14324]|uniref:Cytochrome P450 n=1 Tax=Mixia osmundae (strain CBS 9802 / IAM 14324 / JCM 22182 / KY 12970) TaxID=764103 RepID=G7E632_MIXOS|nr:uncharacterized protein L969DRAFT_46843 [Mixia osmundae IAM 14324]KEI40556.1 hypothetical protein L969DRAFT_46843 [Mixia osmundae IAM 14324]GAA98292.1 hypothetical protein E5Q_04976 [Mixia osmundae IAM 14324]
MLGAAVSLLLAALTRMLLYAFLLLAASYILPYYWDTYDLRKHPGPITARFSTFWLAYYARHGQRYRAVHAAHQRYGRIVRIAPNQLSIADADALPVVYGHSTGTLKSTFYDAFVASVHRGLFNTRNRVDHTRKRKIISHTFSQRSILELEPYIATTLKAFLAKWDIKCELAKDRWECDALPWFNYFAFDVIGDLAFGRPFGMVAAEADRTVVEDDQGHTFTASAVRILNERGEYSATQGAIWPPLRPYMKYCDPWFARGLASVKNLTGIARSRVNQRLREGAGERKDLLARLQQGKDEQGHPMGKDELTAEALTQLIAGSDTTSNSSCAIVFFIARHSQVKRRLQQELDTELAGKASDDGVLTFDEVKRLPYLAACIDEGLRRHSTSSIGLPRIMPDHVVFKDVPIRAGTVLSVPSYTIHHDETYWSEPFTYNPDRWLDSSADVKQSREKAFNPFSTGPRACIGLNVARLELLVFIASLFFRYEIDLQDESLDELPTREGFLRKPLYCHLKISRRAS